MDRNTLWRTIILMAPTNTALSPTPITITSIIRWSHRYDTYDFEPGTQHTQFAEAHVEWRAGVAAVRLLYHDHVNGPRQRRTVDLIVKFAKVRNELAEIVHRIHG
jgi:hypothetical protein